MLTQDDKMGMKKKISIQEIARDLNLSRTTIYKAINNEKGIRHETKLTILKALREHGHLPEERLADSVPAGIRRIGFLAFTPEDYGEYFDVDFLAHFQQGIRRALYELKDFGLDVVFEAPQCDNGPHQKRALQKMLAEGIEALAIVPQDVRAIEGEIDRLIKEGFPVVTVNRDMPTSHRLCYIGSDYIQSGMLAAEVLGKMSRPGNVAMLFGSLQSDIYFDIRDRTTGFRKAIADFPELNLLPPYKFNQGKKDLERYLDEIIGGDPDLSAIFDITCNISAICRALIRHNKEQKIRIVGFDFISDEAADFFEKGVLDAVIFQDLEEQAYRSIKLLFHTLSFDAIPDSSIINSRLEIIMRHNLQYHRTPQFLSEE